MFPAFPAHATTRSLLIAGMRLGVIASIAQVARQVAGSYAIGDVPYGAHAGLLAERTFRGHVRAEALVRLHSFARFHGAFLSARDEAAWVQANIVGDGSIMGELRPAQAHGPVQSHVQRYCAECAEVDLRKFGCAHWLVGHQLPPIHHCWLHGSALFSGCRGCGTPFTREDKYRLPMDPCSTCGSREGTAEARSFPPAYWPYLELCSRVLAGCAPEVRPAARLLIVAALRGHSKASLAEDLLRGWGVATREELELQLGCKVPIPVIERLLRGGSSAASSYLVAAIVSFATSRLSSDVVSLALRDADACAESGSLPESRNAHNDLEGTLTATALAVGYSVDAAKMLARGMGEATVRAAGLSSTSVTRRFIKGLEPDVQQQIADARSRQRESLKPQKSEDRTRRMRTLALDMRAAGAWRSSIASSAYKWLKANDRQWFDENFPAQVPRTADARRVQMRAIAIDAISRGLVDRTSFYKESTTAYKWLLHNDPAWFKQQFPAAAVMREEELRTRSRAIAISVVASGRHRRVDVARTSPGAYAWLKRHDEAWLDETFPLIDRRRQEEEDRVRWRAIAVELITGGYCRRIDLMRTSQGAYTWLKLHDELWLNEMFPLKDRWFR